AAGETQTATSATGPTRRLENESPAVAGPAVSADRKGRRWALAGGVAALMVALAVVLILISGSGGSGSDSAGTTGSTTAGSAEQKRKPAPKPKTLTRSELIGKADAI